MKYNDIDWKNRDKAYWKEIFDRVWNEGYYNSTQEIAVDMVKQIRETTMIKEPKHIMIDPVEDYGPEIGTLVKNKLDSLVKENKVFYVDNYRWARVDEPDEMRRYREAQKNGCCGFMDVEANISGIIFKLGFNYGH